MKPPVPTEHEEQVALFRWAALYARRYPSLGLMFAIPNGGKRAMTTARRLKAEGVHAGVPDIFLPVPRGHHGFFIEMKRRNMRPCDCKPGQRDMAARLLAQGYEHRFCAGWEDAARRISEYLGLDPGDMGL